ncbi:MAG: hypothetical protein ACYSTX_02530 [Planctomycetota bacterium]|jgi:hypothetical protein
MNVTAVILLLAIVTVTVVAIFATVFKFKKELLENQEKVISELTEIKNSLGKSG